ncbi:hypothetical protein SSP531S_10440 [Streptomyces spongiicola]|uniref:Dienelactone hydrolase domain-containing protein n=2 Tax=Streptomyces spongiicola TaxID=1690221 RepID=A0A388SV75_9ACTN|nr:hypothetical protein SSP531S_10440 [Streptomyces spongiicola]
MSRPGAGRAEWAVDGTLPAAGSPVSLAVFAEQRCGNGAGGYPPVSHPLRWGPSANPAAYGGVRRSPSGPTAVRCAGPGVNRRRAVPERRETGLPPGAEHRPDRARRSLQSRLMTTVTTHTIEYAADGLTMIGHLAVPAGVGRRPAVLVGPEGVGLSDVERRRADALAELGYVALAFDLHGGRYMDDPEEMLARCIPLLADPDRMRGIGHAALDVLRAEPRTDPDRIAAVGYGTGGAIALELGRDGVELRAIATVNGLTTGRPGEAARIRCPVWAGVGSEDPIMPPAQRDAFTTEMQAAGVDWRLVVYGGALHAFHHPPVDHIVLPGVGYHPRHARRAWRDVVDLLAECLPVTG